MLKVLYDFGFLMFRECIQCDMVVIHMVINFKNLLFPELGKSLLLDSTTTYLQGNNTIK